MSENNIKNNYDYYFNKLIIYQKNSLKKYLLNNGEYIWIRKINKNNPKINYIALDLLACLLKIPLLKSCYLNSYQAIQDEINIISNLMKNNINTPNLLAYNNNIGLMTLDFSSSFSNPITLHDYFKKNINNENLIITILELSIQALLNIHSKNQYLSQAFIRNIMIDENQNFIFFDFEEDPGRKFNIYECQIRDCLFFILSSSYLLKEFFNNSIIYWNNYIKSRPVKFQNIFYNTIKNLLKIKSYKLFKLLGKDSKNFFYALKFLEKF